MFEVIVLAISGLVTMAAPIIVSVLIRKFAIVEPSKQNKLTKSYVASVLASSIIYLLVLIALWCYASLNDDTYWSNYNAWINNTRLLIALLLLTVPVIISSFWLAASTSDYATRKAWRQLPKEKYVFIKTIAYTVAFEFALVTSPSLGLILIKAILP